MHGNWTDCIHFAVQHAQICPITITHSVQPTQHSAQFRQSEQVQEDFAFSLDSAPKCTLLLVGWIVMGTLQTFSPR